MMVFLYFTGLLILAAATAYGSWQLRRHYLVKRFVKDYYGQWTATPKKYKVLLVFPTLIRNDGRPVKQLFLLLPGITGAVLAALTPDDWDIEIVFETIEKIPFDADADLIAVSGMGVGLWQGIKIAKEFKARGKQVVMGGLMASLIPGYILENGADAVCVGDAEGVWEKILRDFEQGKMKGIYNGKESASLSWPLPRYDLIARKRIGFVMPVFAGRGCPHSCDFCSIAAHYHGQYCRRSTEEVIRDIKAVKRLGFKRILLVDDNIAADPAHAIELFSEIKKLDVQWVSQCALYIADKPGMLEAAVHSGCLTLSFGLETVNQASLNSINKLFVKVEDYEKSLATIREAGIDTATEMVLGIDGDDPGVFDRTADFIIRNRVALPKFYILTPIPGTPLYERLRQENRIIDHDFTNYNASQVVFQPLQMGPDQLDHGYWRLYEKVFTIPMIFKRVLGSPIKLSLFSRLLILFINLHYRRYVRKRIAPGML
jgi:radical SAM superfamily enzyme YgiQ (UPF0313 family)